LGANPDQPDGDGDTPRECAKDDPVLSDLLFRASMGTLDTADDNIPEELRTLGNAASAESATTSGRSRKEEIAALDDIPIDIDDGDDDMW
jgi:hypothetical protein